MSENCASIINGHPVKDATARAEIENLKNRNRRIVLMADSWGNYDVGGVHYSFTETVKNNLDALYGPENIINISVGSRGFVYNPTVGTFLTGLQNATIENPETVTDIIVAGGTNDMAGITAGAIQLQEIETAISAFTAYCRNRFPNATVKIGCVGNHYNDRNAVLNVRKEYRKCVNYGAEYITNSEYICDNSRFLDTSGIHPTAAGFDNLGYYFTQYILSGRMDISYEGYLLETESLHSDFDSTVYPLIYCKQRNGVYYIEIPLNGIAFVYNQDKRPLLSAYGEKVELCTLKDYQFVTDNAHCMTGTLDGWFAMGDGSHVAFSGFVSFDKATKKLILNLTPGSFPKTSTAKVLNISFCRAHNAITFD